MPRRDQILGTPGQSDLAAAKRTEQELGLPSGLGMISSGTCWIRNEAQAGGSPASCEASIDPDIQAGDVGSAIGGEIGHN